MTAATSPWILEGDGFRYEVPAGFVPIDRRGLPAYRGTVQGVESPAQLTLWASRDRFAGDLFDLLAWELAEVTVGGGRRPSDRQLVACLNELDLPGATEPADACTLWLELRESWELRTLVVTGGSAFVFHCATPMVPDARTNVADECRARAASFHIVPEPEAREARSP